MAEILIAIAKSQVSLEKRLLVTRKQCELQLAELSQHFGESSTESRPQLSRRAKYVLDEAEDPVKEFDHQTLLFSATVSTKVLEIANSILRPGFKYIDATEQSVIDEDRTEPLSGKDALRRAVEVAEREGAGTPGAAVDNTLIHLEQAIYCAPDLKQLEVLAYVLHKHILEHPEDYKVIVFTPTSRHAAFLCEFVLCLRDLGTNVIEIHSKMTQSKRTKASDAFRSGCGIVMFSSDVSARGMDYPDVTMVVQLGLVSRNQYTHRVGRTARVDKEGAGVLICTPYELPVVQRELSGIMSCDNVADMNTVNADASAESSALLRKVHALRDSVADALGMTGKKLYKLAEAASTSWLGFYALECNRLGWGKVDLITHGQQFCASLGLKGFPELTPRTIQALQLHGTVLGTISLKNLAVKTAPNKSTSRFVDEGFRGGGGFRGGPSRDESRWKSSSQVLNKGRTRL